MNDEVKSLSTEFNAFNIMSWLALLGGVIVFLIGLWRSDMQLNERGYYFAVLSLGLFSAISLQKTVRDRMENIPTTTIYHSACIIAFGIAVVLLVIGLWNAELLLSEKGFYGISFFLSLFGAIAVQKNVRDSAALEQSVPKPSVKRPIITTDLEAK